MYCEFPQYEKIKSICDKKRQQTQSIMRFHCPKGNVADSQCKHYVNKVNVDEKSGYPIISYPSLFRTSGVMSLHYILFNGSER